MSGRAPPRGALVLGADYRALGVARSLGRRGVPVSMLAERGEPLAMASRYVRSGSHWPCKDDRGRVAFLRELAVSRNLEGWALIPSSDRAAAMVARSYDDLARHYIHTTPAWDVLRWVYDKRLTYELAERVGVPYPSTLRAGDGFDPTTSPVSFPAALKPAVKEESNALTAAKAWRVDNRQELASLYQAACQLIPAEVLMIQELVPGGGETQLSYAALCRDGVPLASLTARRTRQYPADFGRASTFVETVECPEVVEPSLRLLHELRYTGLIEVEYKRDPRDGTLKLLDMNPRVWGWHTLCVGAGVDFPWLQWLLICGEDVPFSTGRSGVRWLRFATDLPTVLKDLAHRRLGIGPYLRSLRGPRESAIFAWDDPLPGLAELPVLAYALAWRLLHREAV